MATIEFTVKLTAKEREALDVIDAQGWLDYYANNRGQWSESELRELDRTFAEMEIEAEIAARCKVEDDRLTLATGDAATDIIEKLEGELCGLSPAMNGAAMTRAVSSLLKKIRRA